MRGVDTADYGVEKWWFLGMLDMELLDSDNEFLIV